MNTGFQGESFFFESVFFGEDEKVLNNEYERNR